MKNIEEIAYPAVLKKLLNGLDTRPGFIGLEGTVQSILRLVDHNGRVEEITEVILRDPVLTVQLLQIANSSNSAKELRNVSTIDQVLAIIGLDTLKSIVSVLVNFDSPANPSQFLKLQAEIVAADFSGRLAAEVTRNNAPHYNIQEAHVCGLLQNLGRMMSTLHIQDDIERVHQSQIENNLSESDAVLQTLGVSFEDIGVAIAHHWGLPDLIQKCLAPDGGKISPVVAANSFVWHQQCSLFCRRVTEALFRLPANREKIEVANCIDFFQKALHLNEKEVQVWIEKFLLEADAIQSGSIPPCRVEQARNLLRKASERSWDILSSQDNLVKDGSDGNSPIAQIKYVMRLIHDHCNFDCTMICLPSGSSGLVAIAGVGRSGSQLISRFRTSGLKQDIFREVMTNRDDTFVPDVNSTDYAGLIPDWYREAVGAKSFTMLPLVIEGKLLGVIYGDYLTAHTNVPSVLKTGDMLDWRRKLICALQSDDINFVPQLVDPTLDVIYQGHKFNLDLKNSLIKIGRGEKADIVMQDNIVSRMHAQIERRRDKFFFVDFSFNGSYLLIEGEDEIRLRCEEFVLRDCGSISLGHPHNEDTSVVIEFSCKN